MTKEKLRNIIKPPQDVNRIFVEETRDLRPNVYNSNDESYLAGWRGRGWRPFMCEINQLHFMDHKVIASFLFVRIILIPRS